MASQYRDTMFADIHEGDEFQTEDRTVTEADVLAFAQLSGDNHPEHLDEAYGKASIYGERIAHGLLIISMVTGQVNQTGLLERLTIGVLDMNIKFLKAVRFNDTIHTVARITGKRITKNPERGIIKIGVTVTNQHGEQVMDAEWTVLVKVLASLQGV